MTVTSSLAIITFRNVFFSDMIEFSHRKQNMEFIFNKISNGLFEKMYIKSSFFVLNTMVCQYFT